MFQQQMEAANTSSAPMQPPSEAPRLASVLGGAVGGAHSMQEAQKVPYMDSFNFKNPLLAMAGTMTTPQHEKDFRVLEQTLGDICARQCLRRERDYHSDSEMCQGKCLDIAFIYARAGLNEIN